MSQVILITGCSSGFGLLTAARLASRGHRVVATMRNLTKQQALLNELDQRNVQADILELDVTDPVSIRSVMSEIGAKYGHLDVLINNAGYGIGGFFEDLTNEEIREQMETNFFGALNVTRQALPLMRPQKKGKIINLSSVAGFTASPAFSAYNASKWALEGWSESLRHELRLFVIQVILIEPGTYKTKIFYENAKYAGRFKNEESPYFERSRFLERRVKDYVDDCYKDPEDVARCIEKVIRRRRPKFRNIPDIESQFMFTTRRILPFGLFSRLFELGLWNGFGKNKKSGE